MNDFCPTKIVTLEVQQNGIIRDQKGYICARLVDDYTYEQLPETPKRVPSPSTRNIIEEIKDYLFSESQLCQDNGHSDLHLASLLEKLERFLTPPEGTPRTAHALAAKLLQCPERTLVNVIANNYAYPFTITYGGGSDGGNDYTEVNFYVDALNQSERSIYPRKSLDPERDQALRIFGEAPFDKAKPEKKSS